jgi:hypothetical protein
MERSVKRKTNWTSLIGVQHDAGVPPTAPFSFSCFRYGFRASPSSLPWAADNDFHLKLEEIPNRLEDFQAALTALIGAGTPVLVRVIIRNLCGKLGIPFVPKDECDFKTYIADYIRRHQARHDRE